MSRRKTQSRNLRTMSVTAPEAAAFLKLTERSFYRMVEAGTLPKANDGEYILGDVVEAFWRSQFDSEGLTAARTRLTTAQAELAEAELAEQRGELHRASAIAKVWTDNVINCKNRLLAIPTKTGPLLVGQGLQTIVAQLKEAIYEALQELADYDGEKITRAAAIQRTH